MKAIIGGFGIVNEIEDEGQNCNEAFARTLCESPEMYRVFAKAIPGGADYFRERWEEDFGTIVDVSSFTDEEIIDATFEIKGLTVPKKRNSNNAGLPRRWRFRYNAYYYRPEPGTYHLWDNKKEFRLGKTLSEAHRTFAGRISLTEDVQSMSRLIDRYLIEVTPMKAPRTQLDEIPILERLRLILEDADVSAIQPKHCYQIRDELTRKHGATYANRYHEKLSHLFTKAIEWGARNDHPIKGKVLKNKLRPKRHVPDDNEIEEALKVASPMMRCYVKLKLLTGLRMSDMLSLKLSDISQDVFT